MLISDMWILGPTANARTQRQQMGTWRTSRAVRGDGRAVVRRLMVPANAAAMVSGDQVVAKSTFWKPVY
ncbi:MAG: hypothetical protein QOJ15_1261 [Bradyrhizobium sp.]|jgi:hypothetical protein|nr:hypothetical protein [Bradyrhizobium sp.]